MILKMQDICKDYPMGKSVAKILKHVNLEIEEGEYVAIMGPSGSGKTTLMNLIGCLDVPTSGSYELGGRDMTKLNDNQLADVRNKEIGFVFQSFNLLPKLSALDNVALPLVYAGVKKEERQKLAKEALEIVGLGERMNHLPNQLSGGQCQRVAIARAIVSRPKLLLADEPTGALDTASGQQIMKLFRMLHKSGATIIMITHDKDVAKNAARICYIRDGVLSGGSEQEENVEAELSLDETVAFEKEDLAELELLAEDAESFSTEELELSAQDAEEFNENTEEDKPSEKEETKSSDADEEGWMMLGSDAFADDEDIVQKETIETDSQESKQETEEKIQEQQKEKQETEEQKIKEEKGIFRLLGSRKKKQIIREDNINEEG